MGKGATYIYIYVIMWIEKQTHLREIRSISNKRSSIWYWGYILIQKMDIHAVQSEKKLYADDHTKVTIFIITVMASAA